MLIMPIGLRCDPDAGPLMHMMLALPVADAGCRGFLPEVWVADAHDAGLACGRCLLPWPFCLRCRPADAHDAGLMPSCRGLAHDAGPTFDSMLDVSFFVKQRTPRWGSPGT